MAGTHDDVLRQALSEGLLAFPLTPFFDDGQLDESGLVSHLSFLIAHEPAAIVAAGGAGELFSLSMSEHEVVTREAVAQATGKLPVLVGAGYGTPIAREMAKRIEKAGADGILLFPPYLIQAEQSGLQAHIEAICSSVGIKVVVYSRDNGILSTETVLRLADSCPNFFGVKDGAGDLQSFLQIRLRAGDRLALINGAPTAEMSAPQYRAVGVNSYTSGVFSFLPAVAKAFFRALKADDQIRLDALLKDFYFPFVALRNRRRGYSVSLLKAGARVVGHSAGPVRPPLVDCSDEELALLRTLIESASHFDDRAGAAHRAMAAVS